MTRYTFSQNNEATQLAPGILRFDTQAPGMFSRDRVIALGLSGLSNAYAPQRWIPAMELVPVPILLLQLGV